MSQKTKNLGTGFSSYLRWYSVVFILLCGTVGAVNLIVDPQARILFVDRPGFNKAKVELATNSRKGKANALRQCDYNLVVFGTSRAETAISMDYPPLDSAKPYNAALRGGTIYEMRRMAEYAIEHQELESVILSLDFEAFNKRKDYGEDFLESPLAESMSIANLAKYAFSMRTLRESAATLYANIQRNSPICVDRGEFKRTYIPNAARIAFDFILRTYATTTYSDFVTGDQHLRHIEALLNTLAASGISVRAYISPMHVTHLELMAELGLKDDYENWKRSLVAIFEKVNEGLPESKRADLWDFSGYSDVNTELVPNPAERKYMRWYTDSAHTNQNVGNIILDQIYNAQSANSEDFFGVRLTSDNIEEVIAGNRSDSSKYRQSNPEEISRMQEMLKSNLQWD